MNIEKIKQLEKIVAKETLSASASHKYPHMYRVAVGAKWFCDIFKATDKEKQIAYPAGLLHDIVRPATEKIDPLKAAMDKSREILIELDFGKKDIDEILDAIYAHHYPDPKKIAGYSVFLADKVFEAMGAYLVFRRAIFIGESPDSSGKDIYNATIDHWNIRIAKWKKWEDKIDPKLNQLIKYQIDWPNKFFEAFKNKEPWAVRLNEHAFKAGQSDIPTDIMIAKFKPKYIEEKEFKKEALDYMKWNKMKLFKSLIK